MKFATTELYKYRVDTWQGRGLLVPVLPKMVLRILQWIYSSSLKAESLHTIRPVTRFTTGDTFCKWSHFLLTELFVPILSEDKGSAAKTLLKEHNSICISQVSLNLFVKADLQKMLVPSSSPSSPSSWSSAGHIWEGGARTVGFLCRQKTLCSQKTWAHSTRIRGTAEYNKILKCSMVLYTHWGNRL